MSLHVATEATGEGTAAPDQKQGPIGVAHAVESDAGSTLCGKTVSRLDDAPQLKWPGGLGTYALCPACEAAVRRSAD